MTLNEIRRKYEDLFASSFAGFECGEGWAATLEHILFVWKLAGIDVRVTRVREKLGTLRLRTTASLNPLVCELALVAELRSEEVCEVCGGHGRLRRKSGWVRTRCDQHADAWTLPRDRGDHDAANIHTHGSVTP